METIECPRCKSVMGLLKKTPRWALYRCFSCRLVTGQINKELKQDELKDAEREMDNYAGSLLDEELQGISPQELERLLGTKQGNEMRDDMVANTQTQPKGGGASHDWLSALQSYEFASCQVVSDDGGRMCVECAGKYGVYRAFFDAPRGEEFIFQWITSHPSIVQFNKQKRDDLVTQIAQASSEVELDFKENMARVRVRHMGIPQDYYLAVEKSVREMDSVIPIVLATFAKGSTGGSG